MLFIVNSKQSYGEMEMIFQSKFTGNLSHRADLFPVGDLIALMDHYIRNAAVDGGKSIGMVNGHNGTPQAILLHRGHSAPGCGIDRCTLGSLEIQAVMGTPFTQSGILDQFAVGIGGEFFTGYSQKDAGKSAS